MPESWSRSRLGDRVLVAVAVDADLVARVGHGLHFLGKGLDRVAGDELRGRDALEHLLKPWAANLAGEKAARDIVRRFLAAIAAQPARHGIASMPKPHRISLVIFVLR